MNVVDDLAESPETNDPRLGMTLEDRYRIVGKIGSGGMGTVYEGEHLLIKRRVAIKCLHPELAAKPDTVERFKREALAAASIGHPHIIEVTDMGRFEDGTVFMVLEYLEGRPWSDDLEMTGAQPVSTMVHITTQICDGLDAAHAKGIVHRDLKPENIFLMQWKDDPNFVKILDFGIAKILDDGLEARTITKTGMVIGTPHYMAPEQLDGAKDVDLRADIYSMGTLIFQALTGQLPFEATSLPMLIVSICHDSPPPLRHYRPDLPESLEALVTRMLSKSRDQRPQDCAVVAAALAPFAELDSAPVVNTDAWITPKTLSPTMLETGPTVSAESSPGVSSRGPATVHEVPQKPSRTKWIAGGVALIVIFVLTAVVTFLLNYTASPERSTARTPVADQKTNNDFRSESTNRQEPEFVALEIRAEPIAAELVFDGRPIPNPYRTELPASTKLHRLKATLAEHESVVQEFVLTKARQLEITLLPVGTPAKRSKVAKTSAKRPPLQREERPTTKSSSPASPENGQPTEGTPSPPTESTEPGEPAVKSQPPTKTDPEQPPAKRLKFKEIQL